MPDTQPRPERSRFLTALGSTTLLVVLVLGPASIAGALDEKPWTSVGSAGTVDEDSLDRILLNNAVAQVKDTGPASTSTIRYNIVAVEGLFGGDGINLTTLVVLDSNDYPPSFGYQVQSVCNSEGRFDFSQNAYYIETIFTKAARRVPANAGLQVLSTPALAILQVTGACPPAPPA